MIGRGLWTAKGKQYCIIIDNVGLAGRFGLPNRERDWNRYFKGTNEDEAISFLNPSMNMGYTVKSNAGKDGDNMHLTFSHDRMAKELGAIDSLRIVENKKGQKGLYDDKGNELLEQTYNNITISPEGIVCASILHGRVDWYDVANGIIYRNKPILAHVGDVPMAIVDGFFFPRVKSKWITQNTRISNDNMGGLYKAGLKWTNMWHKDIEYGQDTYYIPWHGTQKVYKIESDTSFGIRRLVDEKGNMYLQKNPDSEVIPVKDSKEADSIIKAWKSEFDDFEKRAKDYPISYVKVSNLPSCGYKLKKGEGSIIEAISPEGKKFRVDNVTRRKFNTKPKPGRKGKAKILFVDDFVFIRSNDQQYPMQYWQIEIDNDGDYWVVGEHQHTKIDVWHRQKTEWWWKKD